MRSGLTQGLRIGLSRTGIALVRTGGWRSQHSAVLAEAELSDADFGDGGLTARLDSVLGDAGCARLPATVIVADDCVRLFMVTPPQNPMRVRDCRAAAAMRFQTLYGESVGSGWQLQGDWNARDPFLACAMPQALLAALHAAAMTRHITLTEIVPQFIGAWNRWHAAVKPDAWFGLVHANTLTLGITDRRRLRAVRVASKPADGAQDQRWLADHIRREALRLNLPVPIRLQLCGHTEPCWADRSGGSLTCEQLGASPALPGTQSLSANVTLAYTGADA